MANRTLDRLLLIPALIVLGSVTLAGCSLLPGANNAPTSAASNGSEESTDDADEEPSSGNCPPEFAPSAGLGGAEGDYKIISAAEFSVPLVGSEFLEGGCFFRVTVEGEDASGTSDFGYLPGDADTVVEISSNLEAGGYEKVADGIFQLSDTEGVFVFHSGDTLSAEDVEKLGLDFGDSFVIVMATKANAP